MRFRREYQMSKIDEKVDELKGIIDATEVKELDRLNYRLSDAIREGAQVSEQAVGWGNGERACALHAAVVAAKARGYMA
jgi:hypothetical protein